MSIDQPKNNLEEKDDAYQKDINLLPENMPSPEKIKEVKKPSPKMTSPVNNSVSSLKKSRSSAWKKLLSKFFKKPPLQKQATKPQGKKSDSIKFFPSKKPSLQVDIKPKAKTPDNLPQSDRPTPPVVSDASPAKLPENKTSQDSVGAGSSAARAKDLQIKDISASKPVSDESQKNNSFTSIKEMVDRDYPDKDESEGFDVNLIPSELITADSQKNFIKKIIIAAAVSILAVVVLYLGISILGSNRQDEIQLMKNDVERLTADLEKAQDTLSQLSNFTKQVGLVGSIVSGQKKWSELFDLLEAETISEVYYTSVTISSNDQVSLEVTAKSYHDLARQYLIFQNNPKITNLYLGAATMDTQVWEDYLAELKLQTEKQQAQSSRNLEEIKFELPTYNQMQQLITIDSNISFVYQFEDIE